MNRATITSNQCNNSTNRKLAELQKVLDFTLDIICTLDADGRFVYASAATKSVWGYEPQELIGRISMDLVHPDDHRRTMAAAEAIMAGMELTNFENRYIRKDGSVVPVVWSATWDEKANIMHCVAKDATEKKQLDERLNKTRVMFESFMNHSPFAGWITDQNALIQYMNTRYLSSYGFSELDFGKSIYELFPPQIAVDFHMNNLQVVKAGKAMETIEKGVLPNGAVQVLQIFRFPISIDGQTMIGAWAVNITEQISLQEQLTQNIQRYEYVNKATSEAIFEWNIQKNEIYRGRGFNKIFGYELSQKPLFENVHPEDKERVLQILKEAINNPLTDRYQFEYRFTDNKEDQGSYKHLFIRAFIFRDGVKAIKAIGSIQDITEQKHLQQQLIEQEKKVKRKIVKSIIEAQEKERRKLSVELHDNVNQMLTSCKLMLEYAKENQQSAPELTQKCYESLQQVISEIRTICHDLNPSVIEDVGLAEAIEQMIEKINCTGKLKVHFQQKISANIKFQEEEKITVYRIVQEQLSNIIKHANASNAVIALSVSESSVNLSIKDDGKGFEVNKVRKGLGLRNVMHRVEYYHGTCNINSEPGKGCSIEIQFNLL